jgi:hypothetical protein
MIVDEGLVQAMFWIGLGMWGIGHRMVEQSARRRRRYHTGPMRDWK